jgi:cell division protein FtsB
MHTGAVGPTRPARTTISPRRIIVAGVLTALMAGYIGPVRGYLDQRAELRDEQGKLAMLEQRRDTLRTQLAALGQDPVLEARARQLGLVKPGERAFLVRGDLDPPPRVQEHRGDGGPFGWVTGRF